MFKPLVFVVLAVLWVMPTAITTSAQQPVTVTSVARGLNNPRGAAALPDGSLLVAETGLGTDEPGAATSTSGQISQLTDANNDGDYNDVGERAALLTGFPSYNSLDTIFTGHDEPFGLSDVLVLDDGRVFFNKDDPYFRTSRNTGDDLFFGDTGLFQMNDERTDAAMFLKTAATVNSVAYDPARNVFYITESGFNRVTAVTPNAETTTLAEFPLLANGQQAVPSGVAVDPASGAVYAALFSGFIYDYYGTLLSYVPGDSKIVRIDAETGTLADAVTGLTTCIDVATDPDGNLYFVELAVAWPLALTPFDFDLTDPTQLPDPGGYARYTGRVSVLRAESGAVDVLADGIDTPTNITYANGALYVSRGLGTPGRKIWTPQGIEALEGEILKISGF